MDTKTQHPFIDQLFSAPKWVRLSKRSGKPHELLMKILRAVPERSRDELEKIVGENFVNLNDGNVSDFQKRKASGKMANDFITVDEKGERQQMLMNSVVLLNLEDYPSDSWGTPVSLPGSDVLVPQESKLNVSMEIWRAIFHGMPDQDQNVSKLVVSAMLAVKC